MTPTFLVEIHVDDVLEVLLVGFKFIYYKIEINKNYWKIHSNLNSNAKYILF